MMNNNPTQRLQHLAIVTPCIAILFIAAGWSFARFVHYHSQNRLLNPADYEAEVFSEADYKQLSDPGMTTVQLSDGRKITKAGSWQSIVQPNYKPLDGGKRYILVTVKGTAPFLPNLEATFIPVLIVLALGLVYAFVLLKRERKENEKSA